MTPGVATGDLLEHLVAACDGVLEARVVDPDGAVVGAWGTGTEPDGGRVRIERRYGASGQRLVLTCDAAHRDRIEPFVDSLLSLATDRSRLALDMESMESSSIALMEEVSMIGEVMTRLSSCLTDEEVAHLGLEALMVAASVERGCYVGYDASSGRGEVLVQLEIDGGSPRPVRRTFTGDVSFDARTGIVGRAIAGRHKPVLVRVPEGERLGAPGSPEWLARRQVLAVPVGYGDERASGVLGVIVLIDRRADAFAGGAAFGSQETKMATNLASILGSALGGRRIAQFGKELELAHELQASILPRTAAAVPGFDVSGRCEASSAVGGDYFDFLPMADGRTLVVVADVSGHNLASGMVMVGARAALRLLAARCSDPGEVFDGLLDSLFDDLARTERFVTAAAVALRPHDGSVEIVNAGHNDTLCWRARSGTVERFPATETVLGFLPGVRYGTTRVELEPGDVVLLYTDGVTEAVDASGDMFGDQRLEALLSATASGSSGEILERVFTRVVQFADVQEKRDDVTAVVIRYVGSEEGRRR